MVFEAAALKRLMLCFHTLKVMERFLPYKCIAGVSGWINRKGGTYEKHY